MFIIARVASVVHDGDGWFDDGFLTHPALRVAPEMHLGAVPAVKIASQPVPILRLLQKLFGENPEREERRLQA